MNENLGKNVFLACIGRKGRDFFRRRSIPIVHEQINLPDLNFELAKQIAAKLIDSYIQGKVDAIYFIYNEFKSVMQQVTSAESRRQSR